MRIIDKNARVSFERNKPRADKVRVLAGDAARKQLATADGFDAIAYDNDFLLTAD
jgi:hypothetical protein